MSGSHHFNKIWSFWQKSPFFGQLFFRPLNLAEIWPIGQKFKWGMSIAQNISQKKFHDDWKKIGSKNPKHDTLQRPCKGGGPYEIVPLFWSLLGMQKKFYDDSDFGCLKIKGFWLVLKIFPMFFIIKIQVILLLLS